MVMRFIESSPPRCAQPTSRSPLAFEQPAERTRVALMRPQLVAAIDGPLTEADVDQLRAELAETEGMHQTLRCLAS